jgi:histidine decarboxylase
MREVCVFLSPSLFAVNGHMVAGLRKNGIRVESFDVRDDDYQQAIAAHHALLSKEAGHKVTPRPFLCIAFEDSRAGVNAARNAGMCVIGIASNRIELDRLKSNGANAAAMSAAEILESFGVRNYYQVQYLPFVIHLHQLEEKKRGYPVSLLDGLRGRFVNHQGMESDPDSLHESPDELVELNEHAHRIIPREVLGIKPGSLADVYMNNVGWPQDDQVCSSWHLDSKDLECDIIRMFALLYGWNAEDTRGFVTSGGTEGNFSGLWWQRDYLKDLSCGEPPILLASNQTHYSVGKAAQQLGIEARAIATARTGEVDVDHLASVLDEIERDEPNRPILMNVTIGTTQTGALDDLPGVHSLLVDKVQGRGGNFSIHVDAALMGAVIPIIKPFGDVDILRDCNVKTIAISGHKFFGSVCICGVVLTTASFLAECFEQRDVSVRYLTGLHDMTPSGSRSGFNVLSFHNTLCGLYMHTNARRLKQIVAQCYRNANYFVECMTNLVGRELVIHPQNSLTICFPRPSSDIMARYSLMPVTMPSDHDKKILYAGVCILINVDRDRIDKFLAEFAVDYARNEEAI